MNAQPALNEPLVDHRFLDDLPRRRKHPDWVTAEPLITVGAWETLFHRRRVGIAWEDDEKLFAHEHSETFVQEVLAAGANLLVSSFDKNHYIDEAEVPLKKQLAALCRQHGLRLAVYLRGDYVQAEVLAERLRHEDRLAQQADGRVPRYGPQEWRKMVCFHKPANLESFQQSIRRAVVELGVDALFLDGFDFGGMETCGACRCEACRRDFTQFLIRRWGDDPAMCKRRFGHTQLDAIEPPGLITVPLAPSGLVIDPVWQEWIRFRCTWSARYARAIAGFVEELNPEVALIVNHSVQARENLALMIGSDLPEIGASVDVLINESGYHPRITAEGRILQHVREYKMATQAGCFGWTHVDTYGDTPRKLRQEIAHAAAFNRGRVTEYGHALGMYSDFRRLLAVKQAFARWLQAHWTHYQELEEIVDVAVWRETAAMAFAAPITYATAMQAEQLLIEDRLPFTVAQHEWPAGTRVVVLPNLVALDDRCCEQVTRFVTGGGSALVIGSTSSCNGWARKRLDYGLRPILPAAVQIPEMCYQQHIAGAGVPVEAGQEVRAATNEFQYHNAGTGRVVYVPSLVDPATQPGIFNPDGTFNLALDVTNWRVPAAAAELRPALNWLLRERPTITMQAERGVLANYYRQARTNRLFVHLVNLNAKPAANIDITVALAPTQTVREVQLLTPDRPVAEKPVWRVESGLLRVMVPVLDVYDLVVIQLAVTGTTL